MVWSLFDPRPIPVVVAMSVGQVLGTLSFATFLWVVASDLKPLIKSALTSDDQKKIDETL